jgi:hypothetical protein
MSEKRGTYGPAGTAQTIEAFQSRPCSLPPWHPDYKPPEPEEVDALIKAVGWSQNTAAMIAGVPYEPGKGSTTIRRWRTARGKPNHRQITNSAWRLMLLHAGVVTVEDGLRALEKAP